MKKINMIMPSVLIMITCIVFYMFGGLLAFVMLPLQLLLSVVYTIFSDTKEELLMYNSLLMAFSLIGIFVDSQLYFAKICYDAMGEELMYVELIGTFIYICILTIIGLAAKHICSIRNKNNENATKHKKIGKYMVFLVQVWFSSIPNLLLLYGVDILDWNIVDLFSGLLTIIIIAYLIFTLFVMLSTYGLLVYEKEKRNVKDFVVRWLCTSVFALCFSFGVSALVLYL